MIQVAYTPDATENCNSGGEMYPVGEHMDYWMNFIDLIVPKLIEIVKDEPINIWCSGSSGAILAALLVKSIPNKTIICHVKKEFEGSHHGNMFNKRIKTGKDIILDDFMRSGNTINRIYQQMIEWDDRMFVDVMIIANCYKEDRWRLDFIPTYLIMDERSIQENDYVDLKQVLG